MADVYPALSVDEARDVIAASLSCIVERETLPLDQSLGRVLAVEVVAPLDLPPCKNAAMDGWAVRGADVAKGPVRLRHTGTALAGHPHPGKLGAGQCVRIMTGAPLPAGADTVVMREVAQTEGSDVVIPAGQQPGQHVRLAGEDIARGAVALRAGTLLRPTHLGLAAALGLDELKVCRRPRVAVLSTGDELRQPGEHCSEGSIYDSNRPMLMGMLARMGCETEDMGVIRDDPSQLEAALARAADWADVAITSAGASGGDADHTQAVLHKLGESKFRAVAMRPGRPLGFGLLNRGLLNRGARPCLLFALPGNPVAAAVGFVQFVRGALLRMQGCEDAGPPLLQARTREAIAKKPGRSEFQRGIIERDANDPNGGALVRLSGAQGSGMLGALCAADCLVVLHHDQGDVHAGEWVDVLPFEGLM